MQIKPSSGWVAIRFAELWQFRDLMWSLAGRDIKVRYKQTFLGVAWVILQPLMNAGIFSIVFGKIAGLDSRTVYPYFLFTLCGQLAWMTFSGTLLKCSESLLGNSQLVSKVYFPRLVLPLSSTISNMVDLVVALAMVAVLLVVFHLAPGPQILLLPLWLALLMLMGLAWGLITSALMVTYRDVKYIVPVATQMLMYASPVGYPTSQISPDHFWLRLFFKINPLTSLIEGLRYSLLPEAAADWPSVGISAVSSVVLLVVGMFTFKRMERRFADVI
jgi:lipopolysaccharide transport system permease protein